MVLAHKDFREGKTKVELLKEKSISWVFVHRYDVIDLECIISVVIVAEKNPDRRPKSEKNILLKNQSTNMISSFAALVYPPLEQ